MLLQPCNTYDHVRFPELPVQFEHSPTHLLPLAIFTTCTGRYLGERSLQTGLRLCLVWASQSHSGDEMALHLYRLL